MHENRIRKIVVVGGGTAGWMAAAPLALNLGGRCEIVLIESPDIGTIGVGEATLPTIRAYNATLGIDPVDFVKKTQASFKLGIEFKDWGHTGNRFFHGFCDYGPTIDGRAPHLYWMRLAQTFNKMPALENWSMCAVMARHLKFAEPREDAGIVGKAFTYGYHFDAGLYAAYLRNYAIARGAVRVEATIVAVEQHPETGFVTALKLNDGRRIEGDLFIDCSGFRGVLIEQALKTGYEDWSHYLPCDRAVALPCVREDGSGPLPYTRATAHSAGWQWQVPLQHRNGNGHVYCSSFMEADEALDILVRNMAGKPGAEPNHLRFVTGRRKKFWNKNVVALGLSAGFMEPLESTSIHLINTGINKLIALLSLDGVTPVQETAFNRLTGKEYERIRDFLILHYNSTTRDDSAFWNYCRTMAVPDSLTEKVELFRHNGQIFREDDELFTETSWAAVMMGQGVMMHGHNAMADALKEPSTGKELDAIQQSIHYVTQYMPTHGEYLARYCPAAA